jgi:hypothetical protein
MTSILVSGESVGVIFVLELNSNKPFMNAVPYTGIITTISADFSLSWTRLYIYFVLHL